MTEQGEVGASRDSSQRTPQPSLIQQRMQLDRQRLWGLWALCSSAFLVTTQVINLVNDASEIWAWLGLGLWLGGAAIGLIILLRSRRARKKFEALHGAGAGRQDHVR